MSDGFTFQGQGILQRVDSFTSKAGKPVVTLIFEIKGQYPQLIPIKVFGRLAERASSWKPGAVLSVNGRLGGRDWNGKVYGDIIANSVEVVGEGGQGAGEGEEGGGWGGGGGGGGGWGGGGGGGSDPRGPVPPPSDDDIPF
jgi:single-stranded DNA-binding protein